MNNDQIVSNTEEPRGKGGIKKYLMYLSILMVSLMGTNLTDFALSVWVLDQPEQSVSSFSMIWFFEAIPGVLLAVFIGSFVDRWNKKMIIVYGQVVAGIGSIILMTLYHLDMLLPWHIMIIVGIGSIATTFIYTAFFVSCRAFVSKKELIKAQGIAAIIFSFIGMGIPILAPVLYKLLGIGNIFLIDFVTFLVPLVAFLVLKFVKVPQSDEKFSISSDFKLAINFIKERKGVISLMVFSFIFSFLYGAVEVLFTPLILDFSDEYTLGIVLSVVALGTLLGGMVMSEDRTFKRPVRSMTTIYFLAGIVYSCLFIEVNAYTVAIIGMLIVFLFAMEGIIDDAFILTIVPMEIQGRITGFVGLMLGGAAPLAFITSGAMVDFLKGFVEKNPISFLSHLPGTSVTTAIVIIFAVSGVLIMAISLFFRGSNAVKQLDQLYRTELAKDDIDETEKKEDAIDNDQNVIDTSKTEVIEEYEEVV
ncbi:MFS transporter [Aquimarina sp. 2201CG1-2-11]|uniref:MFS transporter n=1 Tax=Aquimarina discodermiae TaxID=3231043 RepID=UPI003461E51D